MGLLKGLAGFAEAAGAGLTQMGAIKLKGELVEEERDWHSF